MPRQRPSGGPRTNSVRVPKTVQPSATPLPLNSQQVDSPQGVRAGGHEDFLSPLSFMSPEKIVPSAWHEHAPFAFWLIEALRPKIVVELGTHNGFSHFAFCQAIRMAGLGAAAFAVDRWTGDEHAGFYGEEVFQKVSDYSDERYADISNLMRMSFSDALNYFDDRSIDLLHIDGQHFYQDVKADFDSWLPKLSNNAVVLFHDINVRERDFGVFRFWSEISQQYPNFSFLHGHGLGVLKVGKNAAPMLSALFGANEAEAAYIRKGYARLGAAVTLAFRASEAAAHVKAVGHETEALRGEQAALARRVEELTAEQARILAEAEGAAGLQRAEWERVVAALAAEQQKSAELLQQIAESGRQQERAAAELAENRRLTEAAIAAAAQENEALRAESQMLREKIESAAIEHARSIGEAEEAVSLRTAELERLAVALSAERQKIAELRDELVDAEAQQQATLTDLAALDARHNGLIDDLASTRGQLAEALAGRAAEEARAARAEASAGAVMRERDELAQEAQSLRGQLDASAESLAAAKAEAGRHEAELAQKLVDLAAAARAVELAQFERGRQQSQIDAAARKIDLLTHDLAVAHSERIDAQRAAHDLATERARFEAAHGDLTSRLESVEHERRALAQLRDEIIADAARERQQLAEALESERAERARLEVVRIDLTSHLQSSDGEKRTLAEAGERAAADAARRQRNFETDSERHFAQVAGLSSDLNMARAELGKFRHRHDEQAAEIGMLRAQLVDAEAAAARAAARDKAPAAAIVTEPFRRLWRAWALKRSGLFDPVFYRAHYPECVAMGLSPFKHYLTLGFARRYKPNAFFDSHWYLEQYEDVRLSGANPLIHYWLHGWKEGRDPGPAFSTQRYLDAYPDVRAAGKNPLAHYLIHGMREERAPKGTEA